MHDSPIPDDLALELALIAALHEAVDSWPATPRTSPPGTPATSPRPGARWAHDET